MKTIADEAGVSRAAVSFALRDSPKVSAQMRRKIVAIARRLGYRPNPLVSSLMVQLRTSRPPPYHATIAFVHDWPTRSLDPKDAWIGLCYRGGSERAKQLGYLVEPFCLRDPGMSAHRMGEILRSRGMRGVIIAPAANAETHVDLPWDRIAAVPIGYSMPHPPLHRVCHNNFHTMNAVLDRLYERGYHRVGFCMKEADDLRVRHLWISGYLGHSHTSRKGAQIPPLMVTGDDFDAFQAWYQTHRPDAIVGASIDVLNWLRRLPRWTIHQTGFASVALPRNSRCSGVYQKFEELGVAAVDAVVDQLEHNQCGLPKAPRTILLEGEWREGKTIRPLSAPAGQTGRG